MKRLKIWQKVLLIILILFVLSNAITKPQYEKENIWTKDSNGSVLVMAHGGGKGVYPDNSFSAFSYSYNVGADVLEMDLQMTKDGVLVLSHGENKTGNTRAMSNCDTVIWKEDYQYLKDNCNFGFNFEDENGNYPYRELSNTEWANAKVHLTRLEELFIEFGDNVLYVIEIKADADAPRTETADKLYELMDLYDLIDNIMVATSYDDISSYIQTEYPDVTLSTSHDEAQSMIIHSYTLTGLFYKPNNYAALQLPMSFNLPVINELDLTTKLLINEAHNHNMAIHYWTINDPDEMRYLIEQGCDGIITDYPELLMEVIEEYE